MTAKELDAAMRLREKDMRARRMADSCVAWALEELRDEVPSDGRGCRQYAARVAQFATALLVSGIYINDAEIAELKRERDHYRDLALQTNRLTPLSFTMPDSLPPQSR